MDPLDALEENHYDAPNAPISNYNPTGTTQQSSSDSNAGLRRQPHMSQAHTFTYQRSPLETLSEETQSVPPLNETVTTISTNQVPFQMQPNTILSSQSYPEVVPVSNQNKASLVYPSTQFVQNTTGNAFHRLRPNMSHSPPKAKRKRKNRPGKKFGARKRSWVWSWFKQDAKNPNIAVCNTCLRAIVRVSSDKGSPKKLLEHLRTHGITAGTRNSPADRQTGDGDDQTRCSSTTQHFQPRSFTRQDPPSGESEAHVGQRMHLIRNDAYHTRAFHQHLLSFLIENKLPINIIRSRQFHQVVQDLRLEAIPDLQELLYLYDSFVQVSQFGPNTHFSTTAEESAAMALLSEALHRH
ncbi:hypothetical protein KGF57_002776 [Candida theae]|uniref:BED-type domain-containing protein n=1 Tax=Candida theae TaxID=1198502 RepID=A0AAD5BE53_9ASCO|nr:uncharacterized protein KGF57_002776 [Candida theae]KAI5957968.1 hypothetical protein KGF57_002776 [Candida theae]